MRELADYCRVARKTDVFCDFVASRTGTLSPTRRPFGFAVRATLLNADDANVAVAFASVFVGTRFDRMSLAELLLPDMG